MTMIGKSDTVENHSDDFDDLMLKEWARENVLSTDAGGGGKALSASPCKQAIMQPSQGDAHVGEGSLVRASCNIRSPFLLSYQEFHKSLVLILADDEDLSIGVILNRPTTQGFEIKTRDIATGDETTVIVPLRFGGEYAIKGDQVLWLHCSPALRAAGVGVEVGLNKSNIWKCSAKDVTNAIGSGLASPKDFFIFSGVTAWTKGNPLSRVDGIQGEVKDGIFEVVPFGETERIWSTLAEQTVLNQLNMAKNLATATKAWKEAGQQRKASAGANIDSLVFNSNVAVDVLADDALQSWVSAHLLGIGIGLDDSM